MQSYFFQTVKAFLPSMLARDHGHIAATVSWMGLAAMPMLSSYCSSKYGCIGTSLPHSGFPVIAYGEIHPFG